MKRGSFLKGVAVLTAAGIAVKLIGFFYRVILTNLPGYGDEGNGIYGAGFQVYLMLYALSTTGFPTAVSRMVAERLATGDRFGAHRVFRISLRLLFIIGLTISLLFFLGSRQIAGLIANQRTFYTMAALSPTIFFTAIMAVLRGYFQGMQDMAPQAGSQIIEQFVKTIFAILLAYCLLPYGVEISAAGATLGTTIGAAAGTAYLWNLYSRRKKELWKNIRNRSTAKKRESAGVILINLIKIAIPVSIGALILTAANIIDLITVMRQLERAGVNAETANRLYGILTGKCYVLNNFPVAISAALAVNLVPAIAGAAAARNFRAVEGKILASLRVNLLIGLPSAVGMSVLAEPILKLLFPNSSDGAYLLSISAFAIIFTGLTQTLSGILQGLGKVFVPALSLFAGAAVKVLMNFTLMPVPHINIRGAIYGTLACYMVSTLINMVVLKRNFRLNLDAYNNIIKPVAAAIVMGISAKYIYSWLLVALGSNAAATVVSVAASAVIFAVLVLLLGAVNAKDINALPFGENVGRMLVKARLLKGENRC